MASRIHTIGHSTRTTEEFLALLEEFGVRQIADVRQYPGSRRLPHFNRAALHASLAAAGLGYHWLQVLGGRRKPPAGESPNVGLRNASFRNYADYMLTPEFRAGVEQLLAIASETPTAIMCAEAVYWRCHRRLISDYLVTQGVDVQHIIGHDPLRPHVMTAGATVRDGQLVYLLEIADDSGDSAGSQTGLLFERGT